MRKARNFAAAFAMIAAFVLGTAGLAEAQRRNDRDIRDAVRALNSKLDDFEMNLRYQMQSSSASNRILSDATDRIRGMRDAMRRFQDNYDRRRENKNDVNDIVEAARQVDSFMITYPQNRRVEDDWKAARAQIDRLGTNYGVITAWESAEDPPQNVRDYPDDTSFPDTGTTITVGLSGTYQLDAARSEKVDDIIRNKTLGTDQRQDLTDKLTAPEQIAIDIRGDRVTLATTNAEPTTFTADGRDKTERTSTGRTIRVRATIIGEKLVVSSIGGETDYNITFTSVSDGRGMKVTRRITTDYLTSTVFADSVYTKTDSVARLGINSGAGSTVGSTYDPNGGYSDNDDPNAISNGSDPRGRAPTTVTNRPGNYTVPNGMVLTGKLENEINTQVSQNNDRFRLTVQSPNEYRGAVVEGYITNVKNSGKVSGRSNITFNFERITLRNGQRYDFAGNLQEIKNQDGRTVKIDSEGSAQGDSQTKETAKRGGIGAGLGAIIGAIAGGAKGAAIGAVIGGGAGAGSVIITGEDDLRLLPGSTISVTSTSPNRSYPR